MKIQASLICYSDKLPSEYEPAFWFVEGSEEQVYWKMQLNVLAIIAYNNIGTNQAEQLSKEINRLKIKYNLGTCPKK